jgi:DNA helicase-2/ATP-dependent DNA helicase PcrA
MRTPNKNPLVATKPDGDLPIDVQVFPADTAETEAVAAAIAGQPLEARGKTAVIARRRTQLTQVLEALRLKSVVGVVAERRGRFVSPQFAWLQACLDQSLRPADKRLSLALGSAAERVVETSLPAETILEEADAANAGFLEFWSTRANASGNPLAIAMGEFAALLVNARGKWRTGIPNIIETLKEASKVDGVVTVDVDEDAAAWRLAEQEIRREKGSDPDLAEFMQGLALRSKSPPPDPNAVSLLTVHASKGLEFDHVYLIGMAESEFPSFQSVKKGPTSPEMEEERRNCFVAVTRTKKTLVISRAERYRGYPSAPSRFLAEMNLMPPA